MKIVTVSDTECKAGGKQIKYCAIVENDRDVDELELHLKKGLEACGATAEDIERWGRDVGAAWCHAQDYGYGWLAERYLMEITEVSMRWPDERDRMIMQLALSAIEAGNVKIEERYKDPNMYPGWAKESAMDAMRFVLR